MLGCKIFTIISSILTNQIVCDLLIEGNEDAKNAEKIDRLIKPLYEKYPRNIFYGPSMHELQSSSSPRQRGVDSPLILSLGVKNFEGLNYNGENALFPRHPSDFPDYGAQNGNHRYTPFSRVPYYSLDHNGREEGPVHWMEPSYSMGLRFRSFENRFPIYFLMPQTPEIKYTGPVLSADMGHHHLELPSNSPVIEILKSLGYALPTEITTYYPITYAKDYFIDVPSSTTKPQNYDTQSLLLGELDDNSDSKGQMEEQTVESYGIDDHSEENSNPGFDINRPSQYYYSNTEPITFEQRMKKPNNIYEILSAEKIIPKEIDMTVHIGRYQRPHTNWEAIIPTGNMAEGSDVIAVKGSEHENVTGERNGYSGENSAAEQDRSNLEILLTGEAVERVEDDERNSSHNEKFSNETEGKVMVLTGKEIEGNGDVKTVARISVVSISQIENATTI